MKYSIIKYLLGLLFIFSGFIVLRTDILHAQSSDTTDTAKTTSLTDKAIEIFTSNTCEFCKELEDELKKTYDEKSYVLNNIDTSAEAKTNFQMALVACNKQQGTVPMFLHSGTCISGKEQILEIFKTVNSANELKTAVNADIQKTTIISDALKDISKIKPTDALAWYDYAITGILLVLFIIGLFLVIRLRKSQNKKFKLFGALVFFVALAGLSAFLWIKVNAVSSLSSIGAEAGKNSSNCITEGTCADWNDYVEARAQEAEDRGDFGEREEWEDRVVDQRILDQQIAAQNNAIMTGLNEQPTVYCGSKLGGDANGCTYADFLNYQRSTAQSGCGPNDTSCIAENYASNMYGDDKHNELGGVVADAIADFNKASLNDAIDKFLDAYRNESNQIVGFPTDIKATLIAACEKAKRTNCSSLPIETLVTAYGFNTVPVDNYSGVNVYVPSGALLGRDIISSDQCTVPTSGGACPAGTITCECQLTPVARYACGPANGTCSSICTATHNVCDDCKSIEEVPENPENPPETPGAPVCQESCSASNPCGDGTSCINGRCENPSCVGESDCLCGTDEISCGDGLINNSDQAPEQCELGNPAGTSCNWDSCNQNTCKCPDSNPNWDIEKTSSLVCINNNTANAYAEVKFNISATYINESSPTTVGVLDKVEDEPVNYLVDWFLRIQGGLHKDC